MARLRSMSRARTSQDSWFTWATRGKNFYHMFQLNAHVDGECHSECVNKNHVFPCKAKEDCENQRCENQRGPTRPSFSFATVCHPDDNQWRTAEHWADRANVASGERARIGKWRGFQMQLGHQSYGKFPKHEMKNEPMHWLPSLLVFVTQVEQTPQSFVWP